MQLLLPIFPVDTKLISDSLGVYHKESIVTYLHSGCPIFSHSSDDLQSFRFITSNFIIQGICSGQAIAKTFHVSIDSVYSNVKKLRTQGKVSFFGAEHRHGYSHKLKGDKLQLAQQCLDKEMSQIATAKQVGVMEGTIRYAIKVGKLKKNNKF